MHLFSQLWAQMDNDWGYEILTEERYLYTSQCYLGPAKAYGLITPIPSQYIINREDGEKESWVLQHDGKPAAFQQPVTDTMWIQRHLAWSVVTRIKLAQIIDQSFLRTRQNLQRRRYIGKEGWERTGQCTYRTEKRPSAAVLLSAFAACLFCWTGCQTFSNVLLPLVMFCCP